MICRPNNLISRPCPFFSSFPLLPAFSQAEGSPAALSVCVGGSRGAAAREVKAVIPEALACPWRREGQHPPSLRPRSRSSHPPASPKLNVNRGSWGRHTPPLPGPSRLPRPLSAGEPAWCGGGCCRGRGELCVTAPAGDFAILRSGPGEEEPAALQPLPLRHHFGHPAGTCFGVSTDFQEGRVSPLTRARAATCLCHSDLSHMTLRCLEPSGNGAEGTQNQWGTAGSAEEPSPEAACLAKALRELGQTGWYWGSMTVNEAKEKLKEAPEGTFLIRDSSHSDYLLTISVKTSAGPTNLRIEYQDGKFRLDSIICVKSKLKQFDSVVHLIDYYVQMCKDKRTGPEAPRNGTVHLYLTKPLYTAAPSLQHLCRLTINKCTGTIWGLPLPTRLKDYLEEYKFQLNGMMPR
ncbi:suppressor of cytokine signaling 2 isoform X2 [Dasypus novemcinctus]|uniref:suppressor of cytokine signaling 2 isoform X2 n=1 Tax=Dasypus novemcinctus TaxID=9361 RepID=UPI00265DB83A|nr:suppressor of cytokine signaling 2 isoform X2 [Dasypus novemcinctus]